MNYDTIITGATLVHADRTQEADVAIAGEKIAAIGKGLARRATGASVIDAAGKYLLPGCIDAHVHFDMPFMGTTSADDFRTGTRSAARGGVTTVIDFAIPANNETLEDAHRTWLDKAQGKACVDFCWHLVITNWERQGPELPRMVEAGCPTFKEFMIYDGLQSDDRAVFSTLESCKKHGALLLLHAESKGVLDELIARHHTPELMAKYGARLHAMSRPSYIEAEAVQRALFWAEVTGGSLYLVHLSSAEGARLVRAAQKRGVPVLAETCPQYLVLDDALFAEPDGHLYACCPQIRQKKDQERLWKGLRRGEISVISTDTCTFTRQQKATWQGDWTKIPMGLPGVETLLPVVYTRGVLTGELELTQMVEKLATSPARIMGLYPRKGVLAKGSDADLVIIDPHQTIMVDHQQMESAADWNPYQGWELAGFAQTTFLRGKKIVDDYRFMGEDGGGRWQTREKPGEV